MVVRNQRKNKEKEMKVKKGAASIYSVIVCAILFSVITVGFVALTVNEMSKSSEFSLSESSKHAAEAGIEDTKLAIAKCFSSTADATIQNNCKRMFEADADGNCIAGTEYLYQILNPSASSDPDENGHLRIISESGGVLVNESGNNAGSTTQAYTCIMIDPYKDDYLGTLSAENPIKIIPLQVHNTGSGEDNSKVRYVEISWYSNSNLAKQGTKFNNIDGSGYPTFGNELSNPPVITASVYQKNGVTINRGTLWLIPSNTDLPAASGIYEKVKKDSYYAPYGTRNAQKYVTQNTQISAQALENSGNKNNPNTRVGLPVLCDTVESGNDTNNEYICKVRIEIPSWTPGDNKGDSLLVLSLPYQNPLTDFKVQMLDDGKNALLYDKVQISVDSTGRANDVYSRVEKRLENTGTTVPIPEYAMTLSEDGSDENAFALLKDFFVTSKDDCWYSDGDGIHDCYDN